VGVVLGVMLGEPLSMRAIVGGAVVLVGVWLTSRQPGVGVGRDLARQKSGESG
jgi:drug/metabolite transporter (DMT)-like permease